MRRRVFTSSCILAFVLLCSNKSLGCSLGLSPLREFDKSQYVFIGEVVNIVGPVKYASEGVEGDALGLRVKLIDKVYSPDSPSIYYEVFPFRLTPSCGLRHWQADDIQRYFPVGARVRVIAAEATILEKKSGDGVTRLEATVYNRGSISRNDLSENLMASADSTYEYKGYGERQRTSSDEDPLFDANHYLPQFELRKDWLRLMNAQSEEGRVKILERLLHYPHIYGLDYPKVAQAYVRDAETLKQLKEKWEARKQEKKSLYRE